MSVGNVDKTTGDAHKNAGNMFDKVGNLTALHTTAKSDAVAAINEVADEAEELESRKADTDMVAADFNAGTSYTAGNYCVYEGKFYKFKNNHSGAWSAADVDEIKIAGELSALKSGLTNVENGAKTLLGKLQLSESTQLPATWKRLYMRVNISDYFNGSINEINGTHILIPFSVGSWASTINIEISGNTATFSNETTIAGTKDSGWVTYVEIYYS